VYTVGQVLEFGLLLWSKSAEAMKLLGQPAAVSVGYYKADFLPSSEALRPREQSRLTRTLERMAEGRAWVADTGRPKDGEPAPELVSLNLAGAAAQPSPKVKSSVGGPSRMHSWTADNDDSEPAAEPAEGEDPPSPSHSIEDLPADDEMNETEHFQRLDGELRIPPAPHAIAICF